MNHPRSAAGTAPRGDAGGPATFVPRRPPGRATWRHLAAAGLLALCNASWAADPPTAPQLRVDAGMHVNTVRDVAVDARGRYAVTASDDKTARVWDVASGVPGPVLRVPIDEGTEGRLQAVVISPDGNTVAVAGNTGRSWDGSNFVYLFDRASGALLRRIDTRAQTPVVAMALSPDGRVLAVGLGGQGGLKLFDFASGAAQGQDANYADSIYALDFTRDGRRLVSGGADGRLHVYEVSAGQLTRLGGGRPDGGKLIAQARFSPDGQLIALGFEDAAQPQVLSAVDLSVVARPGVGDAQPGAFSSLAWSPDGSELWGGGGHRDASGSVWLLRVWPRANFASFADRPAAGASVLSIVTLPQQRVIYTTAEPGWGTVDPAAQVQRRMQSPVASFNSLARQFQIGNDGKRVRYWYGYKQPLFEFEIGTRALRPAEGGDAGLVKPRLDAPGLQVSNWENARGPTLNGQRLPIGELETARSLAVAADGKSFVLGTDEGLWNFDASGRPLWNRRTSALVWAVSQTPDGRLLIAAGQDGTLRWYRAKDGQELMALLPHSDKRRWVLWMPAGYYDAAVGAEELLGWHVNRRADARPDFFPLRTLRARLYRPDVLDKLLDTLDGSEALRVANLAANRGAETAPVLAEALPPVLEVLGSTELRGSEGELRVRLRLRSQVDAPITALVARADGRPAQVEATGAATAGGETELRVRFNGQPQNIALLAENKHGRSAPASYTLTWPKPAAVPTPTPAAAPQAPVKPATPAAEAPGFERKPKLYVLAIGVGTFTDNSISPLDLTGKDVRDFVAEVKKQQGKLYRQVDVRLLVDQTATRDAIMDGLDWLQRQVTQHDVGMLFVAGHGDNDPELGYVFVPHNFNNEARRRTAVSFKEFEKTLNSLQGKSVFFIDTCHSGNVLGEKKRALTRGGDVSGVINELISAESGVVVFSASTGRQYALEDKAWGNGAFTKALVEGLSGKADFRSKGYVTHKMLDYYISDRVKELTKGKQTPVTQAPGGVPDFPLTLAR